VFTEPTAWNVSVMQLEQPLKTLRSILKEIAAKTGDRMELILIGGAAVLLSGARRRVTDDIDILSSSRGIDKQWRALKPPIQVVSESFLCLHPDYRRACKYVPEVSFPPKLRVYRLSPLDLAISKLSRFQAVDIEDIEAILKKEQIQKRTFLKRYATARAYYTNPKATDFNVKLLIRKFYGEEFDPDRDLPKPSGGA
jgi:Nucleotidyltransferase of unknown function (DUF6036)